MTETNQVQVPIEVYRQSIIDSAINFIASDGTDMDAYATLHDAVEKYWTVTNDDET
jgi:hypothetical protein